MTENEEAVELVTFTTSKEAYVYAPLPPTTSYGHRAELWNPDKWLKEVRIKVVTAGDLCYVRMLDKDNGELFAECPLPHDGTPLTTAVEAVMDSSRYFVVKVVDRESRKHAFIGIGFRERMDASDFTAALHDYRQYLRRKQEAEQMRQQFSQQQLSSDGEACDAEQGSPAQDFSLKPGQTIRVNLSSSIKRTTSGKPDSSSGAATATLSPPQLKLAPPPIGSSSGSSSSSSSSSSGFFKLQPPPLAKSGSGLTQSAADAAASSSSSSASMQMAPASNPTSPHVMRVSKTDAEVPMVAAAAETSRKAGGIGSEQHQEIDDDWGDFVS